MKKKASAPPDQVDQRLLDHYGRYAAEPAPNLVDELLWFMLSTRTTVTTCELVFQEFKAAFPKRESVLTASLEALAQPLRPSGFSMRRASDIQKSWQLLKERFGSITLEPLRTMTIQEAEACLVALPGVGIKVARCFLQFGLLAPVFAVDTHIWRISQRLGWIPDQKGGAPKQKLVDAIQALVPLNDRLSLHVNMIFLGRDFCTASAPDCAQCPLADLCPTACR